jgi:hypothetical protein
MINAYEILVGKPEGKGPPRRPWYIDGMLTLEWILGKQDGGVWTGFIWLRRETSGRLL